MSEASHKGGAARQFVNVELGEINILRSKRKFSHLGIRHKRLAHFAGAELQLCGPLCQAENDVSDMKLYRNPNLITHT
jgi:hypothetical protein